VFTGLSTILKAMARRIAITGAFDNIRSADLRFLQEASQLGEVTVLPWPDEAVEALTGAPPVFPFPEREYLLKAVRYVSRVLRPDGPVDPSRLPTVPNFHPDLWVDTENPSSQARQAFCGGAGLAYVVIPPSQLRGFPEMVLRPPVPGRKRVVVTGCYDWFHSGHVRFFEEVSNYGELIVVVGHDANIRLLKGGGHPLLPQEERCYLVGTIRYVAQALVSSGEGWLDADPEIQRLKPEIYAVNEDGDRGGKRDYCTRNGMEYLVLKRLPAPGLPRRSSTDLRGF
jgi:cytidyltransferase-like protein